MTSRAKQDPELVSRRDKLVWALRNGASNELIVERAKRLLHRMPSQESDRRAWLRRVLVEPWHFSRTLEAFDAINGAAPSVPATAGATEGVVRQLQVSRRRPRRGSRSGR